MMFLRAAARRMALASLAATLVTAGCRAKAAPAGGASGGRAEAARCLALAGPRGGSVGVGDHPPPPGVRSSNQWTRDPGAPPFVPEPKGWKTPPGVTFKLAGAPRVERERVVIKGELVNATKTEQRVYLWEAGMGFFGADLVGNGIGRRPLENPQPFPEVYPATGLTVLPAGARWVFEIALILPCYTYTQGQEAMIHWYFNLADHSSQGQVPVKLP
jgi:hypothetical protein